MEASDELMPLIRKYMQPFSLGFPLMMAIMGINGTLRGQGEARKTSYISIAYAAANWILDPILITGAFGFEGFGIVGAAYATLIGWTIGIWMGLWLINKTALRLSLNLLRQCNIRESTGAIRNSRSRWGKFWKRPDFRPISLSLKSPKPASFSIRSLRNAIWT
jgi:Na+-driven multidrug efflux pump